MRKRLLGLVTCLTLLGLCSVPALASVSLTPAGSLASGPHNSQDQIDAILMVFFGLSLPEIYKADVEPFAETGAAASSYNTEFLDSPSDPSGAKITYTGGSIIDARYLLVKGGGDGPASLANWYLFDISGWDGICEIVLGDFWPDQGAISHISIYGELSAVPEPVSIGLFLMGIGCVTGGSFIRRRRV